MSGKRGQPTKYHDDRCDTILHYLREGNTLKTAAEVGGIHYDTLNEWRKKYPDFSEAVTRAEAEAERDHVRNIHAAGVTDWRASLEWLKARRRSEWKAPERHEVTGEDGGAINHRLIVERTVYSEDE